MKTFLRTSGPVWPAVTIPGTQARRIAANGIDYRIGIAVPRTPPPVGGFPVMYLLDANAGFATVVETQRRLSRRPDATGVGPAVIVGIGHESDDLYDTAQRQRDFTPHASQATQTTAPPGGAEAFLAFIEERVKPIVQQEFPTNARRQTLAGHSLSAFFALWTLTRHSDAFQSYVAISPSLWCDETLPASIPNIGDSVEQVFIATGEWEESLAPWQAEQAQAQEILQRRSQRRMVSQAREFAAALSTRLGVQRVHFRLFAEEDHASVFAVAIGRAMRYVFA